MSDSIIQISNMNKWFGDFQVLKGINLEVKPKEKIVVCGPSGSGKSTLIRCINRLEEHQEGNIIVDGTEISEDGIIDPKEGRTDEEKKEANEFVTAHMNTILNIKHLANSPERDIEDMAKEVLRNAGLEESENENVQDSSSVTEENEEDIELLVKTSEIFLKHLAINKSLLSSTPAGKYLSNYQLDFTFTLLLMGAIDSVAQSRDISMDSCVLALTRSLLDNELLGFELDDVMLVIDRVFEAQSEPWGFQVIMQGGQAMASISDSDATDALPLMDLFNNEDTIKELASGIIP